jgi:hypothetical protein
VSGITVNLLGYKDLRDAIDANVEGMQMALGRALYSAAEDIAAASQDLVPFDTGDLAGSMSVDIDRIQSATPEVSISYGTAYALYQHERLDLWHPPKPPGNSRGTVGTGPVDPGSGRGPKYLEFPFAQETSQYPTRLLDRIRAHYNIVAAEGAG